MTTVHLVRHAHAGIRGTWPGDDLDRPLTARGRRQALGIADALAGRASVLWTSPAVRCRQTLVPVADRRGLELVDQPALLEGTATDEVLSLLVSAPDGTLACSHGEVIGGVVRQLVEEDLVEDGADWPKGGWWTLQVADGRVTAATKTGPTA